MEKKIPLTVVNVVENELKVLSFFYIYLNNSLTQKDTSITGKCTHLLYAFAVVLGVCACHHILYAMLYF